MTVAPKPGVTRSTGTVESRRYSGSFNSPDTSRALSGRAHSRAGNPVARRASEQPRRKSPRGDAIQDPAPSRGVRHNDALYETRDQAEAMVISDRFAVLHRGRVEQVGTAENLFRRPRTRFVAEFIGRANLIDAVTAEPGIAVRGALRLRLASREAASATPTVGLDPAPRDRAGDGPPDLAYQSRCRAPTSSSASPRRRRRVSARETR